MHIVRKYKYIKHINQVFLCLISKRYIIVNPDNIKAVIKADLINRIQKCLYGINRTGIIYIIYLFISQPQPYLSLPCCSLQSPLR